MCFEMEFLHERCRGRRHHRAERSFLLDRKSPDTVRVLIYLGPTPINEKGSKFSDEHCGERGHHLAERSFLLDRKSPSEPWFTLVQLLSTNRAPNSLMSTVAGDVTISLKEASFLTCPVTSWPTTCFRVSGLGLRVYEFRAQGLRFGVYGLRIRG